MACLPLANILHHKLRSLLSALGVGIGICMLVTLTGLSRGSLGEIANRWEAVQADLMVFPRATGSDISALLGARLPQRLREDITENHPQFVERVVPVSFGSVRLAGQDHRVAGIDSEDFPVVTGGRDLVAGRLADPNGAFAAWIVKQIRQPDDPDAVFDPNQRDLAKPGRSGLEMVIDSRLAAAGGFDIDRQVEAAGHTWTIVGIVPAGGITRVYVPRRTAQYLWGLSGVDYDTLMLIDLRDGVDAHDAAADIEKTTGEMVVPVEDYRAMLVDQFSMIYTYVDAVNVVALVIAFLFIMVTLHTMVLQHRREIAILRSQGATGVFLMGQVLGEAMLLSAGGTIIGISMSFLAAWGISQARPLLTTTITPGLVLSGAAAALVGAALSAIVPAWQAARVDMLKALTLE